MLRDEKTGFELPASWITNVDQPSTLYFLLSAPYLKIGIATNMDNRMEGYRLHNPHPLELIKTRIVPRALARQVEMRVHAGLRSFQLRGEWFDCQFETAYTVAKPIIAASFVARRRIKSGAFGNTRGNLAQLTEKIAREIAELEQ